MNAPNSGHIEFSELDTEPLTDALLRELLNSPSAQSYCDTITEVQLDLATYLNELLELKGMKRIDVIHAAGINETFGYQIFKGHRHPSRNKVLLLAFALNCTLRETQRMLRHAGVNELYCRNRRDAIILFCIDKSYTLAEVDEELFRFNEETLQDAGE